MIDYVTAVGLLATGVFLLTAGAEYLVNGSQTLALRWGISPLVVGLTIVAFGTSAPELLASVVAALFDSPDLAVGNVVGSNIANIGLVLGLAALIRPLAVHRRAVAIDTPIALVITLVLVGFLWDRAVYRWEGAVLFAGVITYLFWRIRKTDPEEDPILAAEQASTHELNLNTPWLVVIVLVSIGALSGGAYLFVKGAQALAGLLGVPERVIGLTLMALGTSLPEVATCLAAARKNLPDIVVGNVVGSNIFNILSVIGLTALITPLENLDVVQIDMVMFAGSATVLLVVMLARLEISRLVGGLFVAAYLVYVVGIYYSAHVAGLA